MAQLNLSGGLEMNFRELTSLLLKWHLLVSSSPSSTALVCQEQSLSEAAYGQRTCTQADWCYTRVLADTGSIQRGCSSQLDSG